MFKLAERQLDAELTDEQIQTKKAALADILRDIEGSREAIKKEIPKLAKLAILKDKAEGHKDIFLENYQKWEQCKKEIDSVEESPFISSDLPIKLKKKIEEDLLPDYLKREQISKLKTQITLLSFLLAFISYITTGIIRNLSFIILLVIYVPIIYKLYVLTITVNEKETIKKLLIPTGLILIGTIIILYGISLQKYSFEFNIFPPIGSLFIFMGLLILLFLFSEKIKIYYFQKIMQK